MTALRDRVEQVLKTEAAPALEMDGTEIEVLDVADGVARVRLNGACSGCPASITFLLMGLEQELLKRIPEIKYLEAAP